MTGSFSAETSWIDYLHKQTKDCQSGTRQKKRLCNSYLRIRGIPIHRLMNFLP